jgi:hypothetical protein
MSNKHHFRKVYKSDHLGVADLEDYLEAGVTLEFTIKEVKQEKGVVVAGKRGDYNIAYFTTDKGRIKPLVLNVTNAKIVKSFCKNSSFVEDWNNVKVELYIDEAVRMKGQVVGGVRINPVQPKERPVFLETKFESALKANATIESIKKNWDVSPVIEKKWLEYVSKTKK